MNVIAHISDVHIDSEDRSVDRAERVLRYLAGLPTPVDVVLVTGDIADHGTEQEYERVRQVIDLPVPTLMLPGNHDVREAYRKILLEETPTGGPINSSHRVGGMFFAMCDSSIPGRNDGLLEPETLDWLDAELAAASDVPAFVCFHHPPVTLEVPFIDGIRQFSTDRLAEIVARHDNVVAVLCGHAHTPAATMFAGKPVLVAPSVSSTLLLPFESDDVITRELPPMLAFHVLDEQRRLTTHYRVVL
ncbi:3',5'-cyclic adenosine monophosphate phosphodiesterase CpdA [Paractinoplanes deccanensis]|uniref:3',5'-cyclic adenosine monophosphate phosphodiesterase CpdA n=1 Tax=Paractinoplanes deccanensis TaxID=113561 RepID=A0ABQ3Y816_9ACTN|nr:phosphodiesterase [Actinoplanes deccanensis]GID76145.1 3',5'-cyclic adenosine monophosphate phosphodiesterase CpdA [Actinoplanes deccanensis]